MVLIRQMLPDDICAVARIHNDSFPNDVNTYTQSRLWVHSKFLGWPVNRYYVAIDRGEVIGYSLWVEKGGLRNNCVLELEQLSVSADWRGRGVGTQLIDEPLAQISSILSSERRYIKLVEVTTGATNEVQYLYKKALAVVVECIKKDFFDEDEVVLIARHSSIDLARERRGMPPLHSDSTMG